MLKLVYLRSSLGERESENACQQRCTGAHYVIISRCCTCTIALVQVLTSLRTELEETVGQTLCIVSIQPCSLGFGLLIDEYVVVDFGSIQEVIYYTLALSPVGAQAEILSVLALAPPHPISLFNPPWET